jgi:putative ABC transport system permease protein
MRRLIALMLGLLAITAGAGGYFDQVQQQQQLWLQAAADVGVEFAIPLDPKLADPDTADQILTAAADGAGANVFRTAVEYGADDRPRIVLYALLTSPTDIERAFPLASGRWLAPDDAEHPERFVSSADNGNPDQVGRLADFGGGDDVSVRSLNKAFDSMPTAGVYVAEAANLKSMDTFFQLLARGASIAAGGQGTFQPGDFQAQSRRFAGVNGASSALLAAAQAMIIFATALLIAYRALHRAKAVGVMQLLGLDPIAIWYQLTGRLILAIGLFCAAIVGAASLLIHDGTTSFALGVALAITRAFAVMLVASGVASAALLVARPSDSIKNRKPTRIMFALNALVKTGFTLTLIGAGAGLWLQYESASAERAQLSAWDRARGYAIFYPVSNGNDQLDMASGSEGYTPSVIENLYPLLNAQGALFIDAIEYEPGALAHSLPLGAFRSVTVNVNFLRRFALNDANGQSVEVADTTTDWVVLVPERFRSQAAEVETWLRRTLSGRRAAEHIFGGSVPDVVANQNVSIRWIADSQEVFSFNPLVNSDTGNMISDPIVQVMTSANSVGIDRANAITGDVGAALKVAVGDAETTDVLANLQTDLRSLRLDDNLRHLVTLEGYVALEVARIENTILAIAMVGAVLLVGLLYLSAASVAVLFERYSRRVVVRRLHGAGFVRRYREPILIFAGIWIGQLVGALAINRLGANPFSSSGAGRMADDRVIVAVALAIAVLEASMSAFVITSIERRGLTRLLKEEF